MSFSAGFSNTFNALANGQRLKAQKQEAQQQQQQKVIDDVNKAIDLNIQNVSPMIEQAVLSGTINDPEMQKNIATFVDRTMEMIKDAEDKGFTPTIGSQQFMAIIDSKSRGQTQEQIQQNELNSLREQETVKAEVKEEFRAPPKKTEVETLADLNTRTDLNDTEKEVKRLLNEKYTKQSPGGDKIFSRTVTVETPNGAQIFGVTENGEMLPLKTPDGQVALNENAQRLRESAERLGRAEDRKTFNSFDKQYKDFAMQNRPFMDLMDTYTQLQADDDPTEQSVKDNILVMSYIRRVKPTGTISSNFDLGTVDKFKNMPEGVAAGIRGTLKDGKVLPPRVREALTSFLSKEYDRAKQRESSVVGNIDSRLSQLNSSRPEDQHLQWAAPIYTPTEAGIKFNESSESSEPSIEDLVKQYTQEASN